MQGSFEKKVQEKLDELNLTPGTPVWEKIALQIQPERKRRRGWFWLAVIAALLTAGGWWFTQSHTSSTTPVAENKQRAAKKMIVEKEQIPAAKKDVDAVVSQPTPNQISTHKRTAASGKAISREAKTNNKKAVGKKNDLGKHYLPQTSKESTANVEEKKSANSRMTEVNETANAYTKEKLPTRDSTTQTKEHEIKNEVAPIVKESAKKKLAVAQKKWSGKIVFSAGWSNMVSPNSTAYAYASLDNMTGGPGSGNVGGNVYRPAKPSKGFAFTLGYAKQRKLSDRLSISVGLQYAFYSTKQYVGAFKSHDTALLYMNSAFDVRGYYTPPIASQIDVGPETYTNRFHAIELPVSVEYQLLKNVPLRLTGGMSYGRLLESNALTFHLPTGVYYFNKQNNDLQSLNLFAGVQYTIKNKAGWMAAIGPVVQYNTMAVQKVSSVKQNLLFAGIKTTVGF